MRTWLGLAALVIGLGFAALILFLLLDIAWMAWGAFGTLLALGAILLIFAWFYDRRQARRYDELER
jgi:hypothetical protein